MGRRPGGAPLNIVSGLREFARAQPGATAAIEEERRLTFAELDARSSRLAVGLLGAGLRAGDPVAVVLGNRLEYFEVAAALAKAGMPMVPVNPRSAQAETGKLLEHAEARGAIAEEALAGLLPDDSSGLTVIAIDGAGHGRPYEELIESSPADDPMHEPDEDEHFAIAYTSGTTGEPKGVCVTHRSRVLIFLAGALEWGQGVGRVSAAVAPLCHGAGFAFAWGPVFSGGTTAILPRWDPERLLAMIERDRVQSTFLVPTHAQMLRALGEEAIGRADLSSLEVAYFNAAAFPVPLKEWFVGAFPGVGVHELYGSTEAGTVTNLRPPDALRKAGSVGPPWFLNEVKLLGDDGNEVPQGEPGELFSHSPYLMSGYLRNEEATAACMTDDGFLSAGDVAVADEEGFITIVDRKKDMIVSGGLNVYPREVENVIVRHARVREVAVIGRPDPKWGEAIEAFVVAAGEAPLDPAELEALVAAELAAYKRPRQWRFVEALPRNAAGKVLKKDLRE